MFLNVLIISYFLIINDFTSAECYRDSYPAELPSEISSSDSPANLTINRNDSEINLSISNQHQNLVLVIFANPFEKVRPVNGCLPLNTSNDIVTRRYYRVCSVSKDGEAENMKINEIFTGCYYFIMINERDQVRWDFSDFYETSYRYLNRRIKLKDDRETKPESQDSSMELKLTFEIPLDCIIVAVDFYEIPQTANSTLVDIENRKFLKSQSCRIRTNSTTDSVGRILIENITATVSTGDDHTEGDPWEVHLTWANLTRGCGRHYYLFYSNTDLEDCKHEYGEANIEAWELMKTRIKVDLKNPCASDIPRTSSQQGSPWLWIGCGLVGFISIIIVFYCIWMRRKFPGPFCKKNESHGIPTLPRKPTRPVDGNEKPDILLMYERGFPPAEELKTFKRCLKQICRGYKIRDVYASSEFKYLENVKKWIGEKLTAGSKVIWFDTPQLRSRLNDIEKYQTRDDFRDQAVPHAVALAKSLFQDTNTQYRRHFVVWWDGYEVDDRQDNPFQLVTPHVRYRLPGQSTELCDHLNSLMELLKNDEELELDSQSNSGSVSGISQPNFQELT